MFADVPVVSNVVARYDPARSVVADALEVFCAQLTPNVPTVETSKEPL